MTSPFDGFALLGPEFYLESVVSGAADRTGTSFVPGFDRSTTVSDRNLPEAVSEPPQEDQQTGDLDEAFVGVGVGLPADESSSDVVPPGSPSAGPLGLPSTTIPFEGPAILSPGSLAAPPVRADSLHAAVGQGVEQRSALRSVSLPATRS